MNKELELIKMVQDLQEEQKKYWAERRLYGNSETQLSICKKKEKDLKEYCKNRLKEIELEQKQIGKQHNLFA